MHDLRDVGGTPGGLPHFLIGLVMTVAGAYFLLNQVSVTGGYWGFAGSAQSSFGITLIPVLLGIGFLFYDGKSILGWLLFVGGFIFILAGILANMRIHFERTSLLNTLIMLGLLAGGIGLILRSLRSIGSKS